ncbi:RdgB/HAM1 family non-canonical purine NTP pyrophosphatase [Commensalibacter papalotli (ex Botero et al. 2024)]|uniref:dITP/XTP pyrophosphatase n=1 Tax=Commensalibacter papalotli (ex Botero et al. 2024) TaxID=2972766 RepID=A0ABM9HKL7_9PROT|nr:RdgB/HAM1 family non-canonical purine NTP pyrophosphatase [Commensalibacter papalotli (ex Botero et al. 2024)]CAI3931497.1 Inosine/xanthosine triphosphate pyrophosphatase [Commensalibacter papalotli (ex Botero et al. 2024)]CAI3947184.1 Inosine/xanthosine triphosphate pyrophosphatase [Commensalibacter papalotli (ex Botero et al. 2024)]
MTNYRKIEHGSKLVVATHNAGKAQEIRSLLAPFEIQTYSAGDLNLPEPGETGSSFYENAKIKALAATQKSGLPSLADDSGFCINALNGDPGIYSARWAGPNKDYSMAMRTMYEKLGKSKDRSCYFISVLCLAFHDGVTFEFEGKIDGEFIWPARGQNGHGYDPIFQPKGYSVTFAEMTEKEKNTISHRGLAFQQFIKNCF